ncbi:MAG: hypothetical protein O3C20_04900 [Verrucomicrobia bacterium]|nr:hypothetical protein [Verrucomicrobiota bacterium]
MLPISEELTVNDFVDSEEEFFAPSHWVSGLTVLVCLRELLKIMESTNSIEWLSTNAVFFLSLFTKHFTFTLSLVRIRTDFGLKIIKISFIDQGDQKKAQIFKK